MDFYPNDAGNQQPLSPLATMLSGVGAGARGYLEGKRAADQHQLLLQQLSDMAQNQQQRAQLFPSQLRQAQHPFEQVSPGLRSILGQANQEFGMGQLDPSMTNEELNPYEQIMQAVSHYRAMKALAGTRETPGERETALTQKQLLDTHKSLLDKETQAKQAYDGFLKTDPTKVNDAFMNYRQIRRQRMQVEKQLGQYQQGATKKFGAVPAPGAQVPGGLFGGALDQFPDQSQPQGGNDAGYP
jgi:hypothetical protein